MYVMPLSGCFPGPLKKPKLSAIEEYRKYLTNIYNVRQLPADEKCSLGSVKYFVNLECADISKHLNRKEIEESWEKIVKGEMNSVTREQIAIDQIACKVDDSSPKLVVFKGAPGVGKTTLSWELCRRWSRGELWTDYSLVVLLRLRDENIHTATRVVDLFQCEDAGISEDIQYDIQSTQGQGVLFLLEGLDEIPQIYIQDEHSIFMKLVTGRVLPASTVLVTGRPWIVRNLSISCSSRLDQLIELLGFSQEQIIEYVSTVIRMKEALPELQTHLDAHPHIYSAMYNPLNARIVVEVYNEHAVLPNTTTDLYTAYCQVLIKRHLKDHPIGEVWKGDLWNLPAIVRPLFEHLCKIAYQGISKEKQQLVFFEEELTVSDSFNVSNTLGFMNSVHPLYDLTSKKPSYNFIHLTLQEFLAAVHICMTFSGQKKLIFFETQKSKGVYKMVLQFLAGLTQFKDPWTCCVLPVPQNSKEFSNTKLCSYSVEFIIWLYESQNTALLTNLYEGVMLIIPCTKGVIGYLKEYTVLEDNPDPQFYSALGYVIAAGKFHLKIRLNSSFKRDYYFLNSVTVGLKVSGSCSSTFKYLSIHTQALKDTNVASLLQQFQQPSEVLCIKCCEHAESLVPLSNLIQNVTELEIDALSSDIVKWLKLNTSIKRLKLMVNNSRQNIFQELSSLIRTSRYLKTLELTFGNHKISSNCVCRITFGLNTVSMKPQALLCSDIFNNIVDTVDINLWQEAVKASLQNFSSDLEYFVLMKSNSHDFDLLNSLFPAIFACPKLQKMTKSNSSRFLARHSSTYNQQYNFSTLTLTGLSKHTSLQELRILDCPQTESDLICHILRALQRNTSVRSLTIGVHFELDSRLASDFDSLLKNNKDIVELEVRTTKRIICTDRDALVAMLEHVASVVHLKKFSIRLSKYSFDFSSNNIISLTVCKILKQSSALQHLSIPLFLKPKESFVQPIIEALSKSTLRSLIFEHTTFYLDNKADDSDSELSIEVAESLGKMLVTNETLQTLHFPALLPDYSLIVDGLAKNKIIEVFRTYEDAKSRIMECSKYPDVWRKILCDLQPSYIMGEVD